MKKLKWYWWVLIVIVLLLIIQYIRFNSCVKNAQNALDGDTLDWRCTKDNEGYVIDTKSDPNYDLVFINISRFPFSTTLRSKDKKQ